MPSKFMPLGNLRLVNCMLVFSINNSDIQKAVP
jgi:hypothetical protein